MNTPPEKTAPPRRRVFSTRRRLLILLVFGLSTGLVLLVANHEDTGQQSSSKSVWAKLRARSIWASHLYWSYQDKREIAAQRKLFKQKISELGTEHPEALQARHDYALFLLERSRLAEAEAEFRTILQIRERVFGPDHFETQQCRTMLATIHYEHAEYGQAEVLFRAALKTQERVDGKETDETLYYLNPLANCLVKQGKREEAFPYAQRAVNGYRQLLGTNDIKRSGHEEIIISSEHLLEELQSKK